VGFTIFVYIVIVNAINLIDGVDGLAGGVGLVSSIGFAYWFYLTGDAPLTLLALALGGSLLGFLVFNFNPARIFMGDSGSLLIGAVLCVLAIKLIEFPKDRMPEVVIGVSKPVVAMALLAYPLVDTLRIFTYRALQGRSPFSADKNHIHHKLMRLGLGHKKTVLVIYGYSIFMIALTLFMPKESPNISFLIVGAAAVIGPTVLFLIKDKSPV
jgi:UDP-N-acetylmuramyl pentapeptide phosphotransferase/UDP-N-acetylglucosamine-1-phosphate transferase